VDGRLAHFSRLLLVARKLYEHRLRARYAAQLMDRGFFKLAVRLALKNSREEIHGALLIVVLLF
jgi:hypothetical protein